MHSTSVYGLELLVFWGTGGIALATDPRVTVGEDSDESDNDNDLVLCDESESESESDDDSHTVTIQEGTSTRIGHRVRHWSTRYADFVQ